MSSKRKRSVPVRYREYDSDDSSSDNEESKRRKQDDQPTSSTRRQSARIAAQKEIKVEVVSDNEEEVSDGRDAVLPPNEGEEPVEKENGGDKSTGESRNRSSARIASRPNVDMTEQKMVRKKKEKVEEALPVKTVKVNYLNPAFAELTKKGVAAADDLYIVRPVMEERVVALHKKLIKEKKTQGSGFEEDSFVDDEEKTALPHLKPNTTTQRRALKLHDVPWNEYTSSFTTTIASERKYLSEDSARGRSFLTRNLMFYRSDANKKLKGNSLNPPYMFPKRPLEPKTWVADKMKQRRMRRVSKVFRRLNKAQAEKVDSSPLYNPFLATRDIPPRPFFCDKSFLALHPGHSSERGAINLTLNKVKYIRPERQNTAISVTMNVIAVTFDNNCAQCGIHKDIPNVITMTSDSWNEDFKFHCKGVEYLPHDVRDIILAPAIEYGMTAEQKEACETRYECIEEEQYLWPSLFVLYTWGPTTEKDRVYYGTPYVMTINTTPLNRLYWKMFEQGCVSAKELYGAIKTSMEDDKKPERFKTDDRLSYTVYGISINYEGTLPSYHLDDLVFPKAMYERPKFPHDVNNSVVYEGANGITARFKSHASNVLLDHYLLHVSTKPQQETPTFEYLSRALSSEKQSLCYVCVTPNEEQLQKAVRSGLVPIPPVAEKPPSFQLFVERKKLQCATKKTITNVSDISDMPVLEPEVPIHSLIRGQPTSTNIPTVPSDSIQRISVTKNGELKYLDLMGEQLKTRPDVRIMEFSPSGLKNPAETSKTVVKTNSRQNSVKTAKPATRRRRREDRHDDVIEEPLTASTLKYDYHVSTMSHFDCIICGKSFNHLFTLMLHYSLTYPSLTFTLDLNLDWESSERLRIPLIHIRYKQNLDDVRPKKGHTEFIVFPPAVKRFRARHRMDVTLFSTYKGIVHEPPKLLKFDDNFDIIDSRRIGPPAAAPTTSNMKHFDINMRSDLGRLEVTYSRLQTPKNDVERFWKLVNDFTYKLGRMRVARESRFQFLRIFYLINREYLEANSLYTHFHLYMVSEMESGCRLEPWHINCILSGDSSGDDIMLFEASKLHTLYRKMKCGALARHEKLPTMITKNPYKMTRKEQRDTINLLHELKIRKKCPVLKAIRVNIVRYWFKDGVIPPHIYPQGFGPYVKPALCSHSFFAPRPKEVAQNKKNVVHPERDGTEAPILEPEEPVGAMEMADPYQYAEDQAPVLEMAIPMEIDRC